MNANMCRATQGVPPSSRATSRHSTSPDSPSPLRTCITPTPSFPLPSPPTNTPTEPAPSSKPPRRTRPTFRQGRRSISDSHYTLGTGKLTSWIEESTEEGSEAIHGPSQLDKRTACSINSCCLSPASNEAMNSEELEAACLNQIDEIEIKPIRKAKTVDFAEVPVEYRYEGRPAKVDNQLRGILLNALWPDNISLRKSSLANATVTKADVQVLSRTPSYSQEEFPSHSCSCIHLPGVSKGCYEILEDDSTRRRYTSPRRRSSSTSKNQSRSPSSSSTSIPRALDRVNRKLTTWSRSNPPIFILPFEDDLDPNPWTTSYDISILSEDEELTTLAAPPNSQHTSAPASRFPSRPSSAPLSRIASGEGLDHLTVPSQSVLVQYEDIWPIFTVPTGYDTITGLRRPSRPLSYSAVRKLSNIEEADLFFRTHRDSLAVARARLARKGVVSPQVRKRKGSVFAVGHTGASRRRSVFDWDDEGDGEEVGGGNTVVKCGEGEGKGKIVMKKRPRSIRWSGEE